MEIWFGIVSIILALGMVICFLALLGYKFKGTYSKEKIEVSTQDSNSNEHWEEQSSLFFICMYIIHILFFRVNYKYITFFCNISVIFDLIIALPLPPVKFSLKVAKIKASKSI